MTRREEILNMVKDGTITVDEALKLLEAVGEEESVVEKSDKPYSKRMLRIRVDSVDGDKVNVNIPISLAKVALKAGNGYKVNGENVLEGIDIDSILDLINEETCGELVSVESDGDKVRIYID